MIQRGIVGYHEASKHSPESVRRPGRGLDWANKPYPYKDYTAGLPTIPLAVPDGSLGVSALDAVAGLGPAVAHGLDAGLVGRILNYGAGVLRKRPVSETEAMYFRTYASAGALYPVEVYAVTGDLPGVGAGLHHYHPRRRALIHLREGDLRGCLVAATAAEPALAEAPLILALTGMPWRTAWKYGPRGFRHLYWDAGMIIANLLALCRAAGLPARVVMGFDDAAVERLLGIDGRHEFPLCLLTIGAGVPAPDPVEPPGLGIPVRPLSPDQIEYAQIGAAQDFGRLPASEVTAWREIAAPPGAARDLGPCPPESQPLAREAPRFVGAASPPEPPLETVIRRRGSARSFDRIPISVEALATIVDRATRGVPTDYAPAGSRLVEPFLIANRVEGLDPGAYVHDGALRLLGTGDFAEQAGFLCLEQWLGHDAAATHFLMVDLDRILDQLGERGYRAAQLEAGVVAGRMYLAAEAHRLGATGLTFYDDEVTRFFAAPGEGPRSCMLVLAIGPATRRPLPMA